MANLHSGPDESQVVRAKEMAEDLLSVVKEKWTEAKTVLDQSGGQQGYGTYNSYNSYGYTGSYQVCQSAHDQSSTDVCCASVDSNKAAKLLLSLLLHTSNHLRMSSACL